MNSLFNRLGTSALYRLHGAAFRGNEDLAMAQLRRFDPQVLDGLSYFAQAAHRSGENYGLQLADIVAHLERFRPRKIVELGSGRSSLIFASYARRTNASFVAYEQDPKWVEVSNAAISQVKGAPAVVHVPVIELPAIGGRFERAIEADTDFIYLDGPYVAQKAGFPTFDGKPAYTDVPDHLARGARPSVVMIERRHATVDAIRAAESAKDYRFHADYLWALTHRDFRQALPRRRHSLFIHSSTDDRARSQ